MRTLTVPDELEFLEVFGLEAVVSKPKDGYWSYVFPGNDGSAIQLSFNTHEGSLQTVCTWRGEPMCIVVREDASTIRIEDSGTSSGVLAVFADGTTMNLRFKPNPHLVWSWIRK